MDTDYLYKCIEERRDPKENDTPFLKALVEKYPYFQAAIFLYLKSLFLFERVLFEKELERLSIFVMDRKALFYYIFEEKYKQFFDKQVQDSVANDKTSSLLSAFLDVNQTNINLNNEALINQIAGNMLASTDYFSYLSSISNSPSRSNDKEHPLRHHEIIDAFIVKSETGHLNLNLEKGKMQSDSAAEYGEIEGEAELEEDKAFFTETLAKIYIKQKKYDKAYKIIEHLSLNYPEKNAYFADQLRFLEKLVINSKQNK